MNRLVEDLIAVIFAAALLAAAYWGWRLMRWAGRLRGK